ncbi:MAG: heavy metal translocating P-type ATPase metal-binding domain-containing protein [Rickettsiales bacterium]|nr:heavy metal translocating P-type ATPase metal-binding domain-containing protein [Rickettsiales bacterium]
MKKLCRHCGEEFKKDDENFCCLGCATAYKIINKFGFTDYYKLRQEQFIAGENKPEITENTDITEFVFNEKDGSNSISLMIQGMSCAACVWLIENILKRQENVVDARINLARKTLFLKWRGVAKNGNELVNLIEQIGYKLLPFDEEILNSAEKKYNDSILRALAVAGFGVGNIMLFSFCLWFYDASEMGVVTRNLLHLFSSLIALPIIIFSSRIFFSSAYKSLKQGYPNMDLAISIAIFLACLVSLLETFRGASHIYFDSALMLIFFLLIGRYLDLKARKKAFNIATEFSLLAASFGRIEEDKKIKILPSKKLRQDMILLVAAGEKISADGIIISGASEIDTALITGENLPKKFGVGAEVFSGMINLTAPLKIKITKSPQNSLLSQIMRLSQEAENKKNHYIRIADYLAKFYTPAVHLIALATFLFWLKSGWELALMNATAVLIITCPCALALAVPIIQTMVISNFIKKGILVKSGEALEKLNEVDIIIFDKTGSLTIGAPELVAIKILKNAANQTIRDEKFYLHLAASLAKKSRHPIAKAISANFKEDLIELQVLENQGFGLSAVFADQILKLGREDFCQIENSSKISKFKNEDQLSCFMKFGEDEVMFLFSDKIKSDAKTVIKKLRAAGKEIILLSGDSKKAVIDMAQKLQIEQFYFEQTPVTKLKFLENLKAENKKFVMIGDGLNDAPALAASYVSISFSQASDLAQNIADIVIQGEKLMPIIELINLAKKSIALMKQNLAIALIYNLIALPFAILGYVVPLIAAIAMSSSSLLVLFNSFRINKKCQS